MKFLKLAIFVCLTVFGSVYASAQVENAMKSYNFSRALEEAKNGNNANALDFLKKEVAEHPNNGYAHFYIAVLQADAENYGDAMRSINTALDKFPKKDKEFAARGYASRGQLYAITGDTIKALSDFDTAIKANPKDADILENHAQLLYELKRYADADVNYRKMVEINPASVMGYMGLGRNAYASGNYDEAVKQYNTVLGMYYDYSSGYAFRAESFIKLGKYLEAADDLMKSLSIDSDAKAHHYLFEFPTDKLPLLITKLKAMAVKEPNNAEWYYYMGQVYRENKKHREAAEALEKAFDIDAHPVFLEYMADSYSTIGEFGKAIDAISRAQQMQPDEVELIQVKADILGDSGDVDGAIAEWSRYIEKAPDNFGGYYRRGFFEENSGKTEDALADYDMAIMLDPTYAYSYLGKGDLLMKKGDEAAAMDAYRKVVEIDTVPNNQSCAMYALLALGEKEKAIDFMNRVIAQDSLEPGNYYDGACFYSRIGELDKSLANLKKALELGFRRIHHIYDDDDLESLRATDAFKRLIEPYETVVEVVNDETEVGTPSSSRVEIPFTPESGCATVKCTINDLPLSFIFDTGASTVSLSMVEANFMLKNGYLKKEDFVGSQRFIDANGDISEGTVVNLRNVDFGGLRLNNVKASVVRNQKAPLLLGQTVLGRLGSIEIDNPGKKLIITNHSNSK